MRANNDIIAPTVLQEKAAVAVEILVRTFLEDGQNGVSRLVAALPVGMVLHDVGPALPLVRLTILVDGVDHGHADIFAVVHRHCHFAEA